MGKVEAKLSFKLMRNWIAVVGESSTANWYYKLKSLSGTSVEGEEDRTNFVVGVHMSCLSTDVPKAFCWLDPFLINVSKVSKHYNVTQHSIESTLTKINRRAKTTRENLMECLSIAADVISFTFPSAPPRHTNSHDIIGVPSQTKVAPIDTEVKWRERTV